MQIGPILNNTAYFSVRPAMGNSMDEYETTTPEGGTTSDPGTTPEIVTPDYENPNVITAEPDPEFSWQKLSYTSKWYTFNGPVGAVTCRVQPNLAAKVWVDILQYVAYITSAKFALVYTMSEDIHIKTDLGEEVILLPDTYTRINYSVYFDVICWKKINSITIELGFDFDGEFVSPDTPSPDTPSPDTPSPDTPSPDTPSPDIPSPDPTTEELTREGVYAARQNTLIPRTPVPGIPGGASVPTGTLSSAATGVGGNNSLENNANFQLLEEDE